MGIEGSNGDVEYWIAVVVVFTVSLWLHKRHVTRQQDVDDGDDPFAIDPCPNPDCIRCRKYAQVNAAAQKWLESIHDPPERLVEALKVGRRGGVGTSTNDISPRTGQYPTVLLIPGLISRPIVTSMHQKCCDLISKHAGTILQEYLEANEHACWLQNDVVVRNDASSWNVLHLLNQGVWNEENAALCPETAKKVQSLDIMTGCIFGNVFLSVLTPGTSIEPHCGPTNARHRLHLALQIPTLDGNGNGDEPVLTVLEERITWKEGKAFVFDDSLMHAVDYPETSSSPPTVPRVVLIVDLWHPDLTASERRALQELYPTTT